MVRGWPGKIILALITPALVLGAIVLVKIGFGVKLVSTLVAGELGHPSKSCQVSLAPVVDARRVTLLYVGRLLGGGQGGGGGDDDRLVVQVDLHLLHVLLLPSPSCCTRVSLQLLAFLGPGNNNLVNPTILG